MSLGVPGSVVAFRSPTQEVAGSNNFNDKYFVTELSETFRKKKCKVQPVEKNIHSKVVVRKLLGSEPMFLHLA